MSLESDGFETLRLLNELGAKMRHLQSKTKRLAVELDRAKKKIGVLEQRRRSKAMGARGKKARGEVGTPADPAVAADLVPAKSPAPRKRQALGRGLAQIRNRYARTGEETVDVPEKGTDERSK